MSRVGRIKAKFYLQADRRRTKSDKASEEQFPTIEYDKFHGWMVRAEVLGISPMLDLWISSSQAWA